jgi:hypothetical protein
MGPVTVGRDGMYMSSGNDFPQPVSTVKMELQSDEMDERDKNGTSLIKVVCNGN